MASCCLANFTSLVTGLAISRNGATSACPRRQSQLFLPRVLLAGMLAATVGYQAISNQAYAGGQSTQLRLQRCFDEISQASQSFSNGRADIANERLLQLTHSCGGVAHLYHNLGAIAALRRDWEQAITYLEQSLAIDRRAAMTQDGLTGIYQYKAALAYRKALDLSGPLPKPPAIMLQKGDLGNGPVAPEPRIVPTEGIAAIAPVTDRAIEESARTPEAKAVRIEVTNWWKIRREKAPELPPWSAVSYSPDTLDDNLAMVLLGFADQKVLLVLKKTRNHWKITKEKQL